MLGDGDGELGGDLPYRRDVPASGDGVLADTRAKESISSTHYELLRSGHGGMRSRELESSRQTSTVEAH